MHASLALLSLIKILHTLTEFNVILLAQHFYFTLLKLFIYFYKIEVNVSKKEFSILFALFYLKNIYLRIFSDV